MNSIHCGDCIEVMRGMEPGVFNCCVTSPPYYGLRDYGTARWEGGNAECDHLGVKRMSDKTSIGRSKGKDRQLLPHAPSANVQMPYLDTCGKCGARRIDGQIGLEKTPDEYVSRLVDVFREVRRVLRDDGTLWLNLGDSYGGAANSGGKNCNDGGPAVRVVGLKSKASGMHPKNLLGIPWRVAFALQADGWYLRQDIIWHKPNPMPESVTDRCTKAHEYIFLLSKSARYYYDADAVKDRMSTDGSGGVFNRESKHSVIGNQSQGKDFRVDATEFRNRRSVWTVATQPYSGAHFATFPPDLIKPCILAGCPEGGTVFDPFLGSGTTVMVAQQLGRHGAGVELNPEYIKLATQRTAQMGLC